MPWIVIYLLTVLKYTNSNPIILKKNAVSLFLGSVSKYDSVVNMKKAGLCGYDSIDVVYILDIHK